jgi:hypothetical protein
MQREQLTAPVLKQAQPVPQSNGEPAQMVLPLAIV